MKKGTETYHSPNYSHKAMDISETVRYVLSQQKTVSRGITDTLHLPGHLVPLSFS